MTNNRQRLQILFHHRKHCRKWRMSLLCFHQKKINTVACHYQNNISGTSIKTNNIDECLEYDSDRYGHNSAVFICRKEFVRANKARLTWRMLASVIAVVCLVCMGLPITFTPAH
jgi:Mlc titration factor MtfA (ptsG expression regulator)